MFNTTIYGKEKTYCHFETFIHSERYAYGCTMPTRLLALLQTLGRMRAITLRNGDAGGDSVSRCLANLRPIRTKSPCSYKALRCTCAPLAHQNHRKMIEG